MNKTSYQEGWDYGADIKTSLKDNPYVPAEGEYDYEQWAHGWLDGRTGYYGRMNVNRDGTLS